MLYRWIQFTVFVVLASTATFAQTKSVLEIYSEVDGYSKARIDGLSSAGKKITANVRADVADERRSLAGKYAAEVAARSDLAKTDFYYLGLLYSIAGNDEKLLESMQRLLSQFPSETKG